MPQLQINPAQALIFRITHRDNLPWVLRHGLCCSRHPRQDPNFVSIGNPELISKRQGRMVPIPPGGDLGDYVPFYFTPHSPMLYNIKTGYGITKRHNSEIIILVSSLHRLVEARVDFVFTDRHAYLAAARFGSRLEELNLIDWTLLQQRDFRRDPEHPERFERYQAEALVYRHLPVSGLWAVTCYSDGVRQELEPTIAEVGLDLRVVARSGWYF